VLALAVLLLSPIAATAREPGEVVGPVAADPPAAIEPLGFPALEKLVADARYLLTEGDYDGAVRNLKTVIAQLTGRVSGRANRASPDKETRLLGRAYLILVKAYVMHGNFYITEPQGREVTQMFYREARGCIEECLRNPRLRHLQPDSVAIYPPEMYALFEKVRYESLGSLRILKLTPADACVLLDGDTLRLVPPDTCLKETDLAAGPHELIIRRPGYKDLREKIQISPGGATEREYALRRRHGTLWYASRAGIAAGGIAAILLSNRSHDGETPLEPYPEPPPMAR
jgi:hypothetical protein